MLTFLLLITATLQADGPGRIAAKHVARDFALTADPSAGPWRNAAVEVAMNDRDGKPVPGHRTEIRTLWSDQNLYILFTCPYEKLYLTEKPDVKNETDQLWQHDVAEVFIGSDFENIDLYKELQVSPQSEWVDLDIDRKTAKPQHGVLWNSGFTVKGRIDRAKKVWYGEMKIPLSAISTKPVKEGSELRINFYRLQGPPEEKAYVAWQPVNAQSYHTPSAFGRIVFQK